MALGRIAARCSLGGIAARHALFFVVTLILVFDVLGGYVLWQDQRARAVTGRIRSIPGAAVFMALLAWEVTRDERYIRSAEHGMCFFLIASFAGCIAAVAAHVKCTTCHEWIFAVETIFEATLTLELMLVQDDPDRPLPSASVAPRSPPQVPRSPPQVRPARPTEMYTARCPESNLVVSDV